MKVKMIHGGKEKTVSPAYGLRLVEQGKAIVSRKAEKSGKIGKAGQSKSEVMPDGAI